MDNSQSIKQTFAARLNQCFEKSGLRKIVVARKIGLTSGGIGQVLSGANFPGVDKIVQLADIFDVSIDWLTGRTDHPPAPHPDEPEGLLQYLYFQDKLPNPLHEPRKHVYGALKYVYGIYPEENANLCI